jgi:hypothetical protein
MVALSWREVRSSRTVDIRIPSPRGRGAYVWLFPAPLALLISARILWEKTLLTYQEGEQMVGFSLVHIHPFFFISGWICSMAMILWLLAACFFLIRARFRLVLFSWCMVAGSLFVALAWFLPDTFGLVFR